MEMRLAVVLLGGRDCLCIVGLRWEIRMGRRMAQSKARPR